MVFFQEHSECHLYKALKGENNGTIFGVAWSEKAKENNPKVGG